MHTETVAPTRDVTFRPPAHIADLIESTRLRLDGQREERAALLANSCLDAESFEGCVVEFETLAVDGIWAFNSAADKKRFMAPLLANLQQAYALHHAA